MLVNKQLRLQILRKIRRIPANKLNDVNDFLSELEQSAEKPSRNLSFAGRWNTIEESTLIELTDNLIVNRSQNKRRFDE